MNALYLKMLTLLLFILTAELSFSQGRGRGQGFPGGTITGRVLDNATNNPIEYSNIVLLSVQDSSLITGGVTNEDGVFTLTNLRPGSYLLNVRFIGFEDRRFDVTLSRGNMNLNLGEIRIELSEIGLSEVVVEGQRSPVSYQIDKRVIDVDQMQTVISGNAADILENIPSVTVDIEGNVSLRGSSNFTVLVDGRPSVLDAQDALQQIPASSISSIEIITNPSAKYDPEGTAGIINIILKRERGGGMSGIINANAGLNDKYGGDLLFEYRTGNISTHAGLDYNRRFSPGDSRQENQFITEQNILYNNSNGTRKWGRIGYSVRAGAEFQLSESDILSIGGRIGERESQQNSLLNYTQWSQNNPQSFNYLSRGERQRSGTFLALHSNYEHKFNSNGHLLMSEIFFSRRNSDELTRSAESDNTTRFAGKLTTEEGPSTDLRWKLDYTLPLGTKSKIESGYQGQSDISTENTSLSDFNPLTGQYEIQPQYSHSTDYIRREHAIYSIYSNNWGDLGFQSGLRTEYTFRQIEIDAPDQKFKIDRWDYFPSVHSSYQFSPGNQLIASYTRRIERPRGWQLEPFNTWMDANNVRRGNPALQPEFIDSYEAGIQTYIGNVSLSTEIYYKFTQNKIERVRSVYEENVSLNTVENIGKDYSLGSELMIIFDPFKFWNMNLMGNLYNYKIEGELFNEKFSRESFNWTARVNNVIRIGNTTQFQFNAMYNSPSVSSQGRREGFISTDIAVRQDLFERMLQLTLQVRDLFSTAKYEFTSQGPDFYNYNFFNRESPVVMLNVRLNFNAQRTERERREDRDDFNGDEF